MQRTEYTHSRTRRIAQTIPVLCGLLFVLFAVCYLHLLQPDFLAWEQHFLSDGQTTYEPLLGTIIITAVLLVPGILLHTLLRLPIRMMALSWAPSCYGLALLTCMHFSRLESDPGHVRFGLLIIMPLLFALSIWVCRAYPDLRDEYSPLSEYLSTNMGLMALLFLLTGIIGNTSPLLHYELKAHRLVREKRYEEALGVGIRHPRSSHDLAMLRTFALSQTKQLPERLFAYPLAGSQDLLPQLDDTLDAYNGRLAFRAMGYVPNTDGPYPVARFLGMAQARDTLHRTIIGDYLLSAYLLDRNLEAFAREMHKSGADTLPSLPRHYEEALLLHAYEQNDSVMASQCASETCRARFEDFLRHKDDTAGGRSPQELCRGLFPDSYWSYYFFMGD